MITRASSFLILLFSLAFVNVSEAQVIDQVVAVVGKNIILQSDIENQYVQYRLQRGISGSASSIRCRILEDLLFQKLMLNQAELDSITVTPEQVEQEMERRLKYFISELGSQEKLEQYYNKTINEIKNELRVLVKDQMLVEQVQNGIMAKVIITPSEVKQYFRSIPKDSIPMINTEFHCCVELGFGEIVLKLLNINFLIFQFVGKFSPVELGNIITRVNNGAIGNNVINLKLPNSCFAQQGWRWAKDFLRTPCFELPCCCDCYFKSPFFGTNFN